MAKKEQCICCKGYNPLSDLCTIKWLQPQFDGNDCDEFRDKKTIEHVAPTSADLNNPEEPYSQNTDFHIRKRGSSSVSNNVFLEGNGDHDETKKDAQEHRFVLEIPAITIRIIGIVVLVAILVGAIYGIYAYMESKEKQNTEDLVWKARIPLETIRGNKTIEYLRIHKISYEENTLHISLLRNILGTNETIHFTDTLMQLEIASLVSLASQEWDTVCTNLQKAHINLSFEYSDVKDKPVLMIPYSELFNRLLTKDILEKGMKYFTIMKGLEIFQYARNHFKKDIIFTVDSVSMNANYVALHLSYDDKKAKLGKSFLDTNRINQHYTDPVGNMGSILDGMLAICCRTNKGIAFVYVGKNNKKRDIWAWDAEKTKELIEEQSQKLLLDGRKTNQVRTVIAKEKKKGISK